MDIRYNNGNFTIFWGSKCALFLHLKIRRFSPLFHYFSFARLERCADILELLSGRYLSVYVVPGVARWDQDRAHVLVAALQTEKLLHQAHILLAGVIKGALK